MVTTMHIFQHGLVAVVLTLVASVAVVQADFRDPLDVSAQASAQSQSSILLGVTQVPGGRLVTVGRRGHILYSDDGQKWTQAQVPVSIDLLAVHFPTAEAGWAVGHGGVILNSTDGGKTWSKQLDGRQLADLLVAHWKPLASLATEDEMVAAFALEDAERFKEEGPGRPFLDVRFVDAQTGYVTGAYNLLLETRDGGSNWRVLSDRVDNPGGMHLNALQLLNGQPYLVGEQGLLLHPDSSSGRYVVMSTPYTGTWFGLVAEDDLLLLFGLRGNAYASHDQGANWTKVVTATDSTITAGTQLADGRLALVTLGGELLLSIDDQATGFNSLKLDKSMPLYGVASAGAGAVVVVGAKGLQRIALEQEPLRQERRKGRFHGKSST